MHTAILLTMSAIEDDPRVRRMGDALAQHGWNVVGIGLDGGVSAPPSWPVWHADSRGRHDAGMADGTNARPRLRQVAQAIMTRPHRLSVPEGTAIGNFLVGGRRQIALAPARVLSHAKGALGFRNGPSIGCQEGARPLLEKLVHYGLLWGGVRRRGEGARRQLYGETSTIRNLRAVALEKGTSALWVANDWIMLPLAAECVHRFGGAIAYDSHEFAVHEFEEHWDWRVFRRPLVSTIEQEYVGRASVVTSVSHPITQAIVKAYNVKAPALTLRNMPRYQASTFRAASDPVRLLYHGILSPGRGLEALIESMELVQRPAQLVIRGPGDAKYVAVLRGMASRPGLRNRVSFDAPVAATQLVEAARASDIGVMLLPGHSAHNAGALPNKIFEYMMAGLGLLVSELPAMAQLVEETEAGVTVSDVRAAEIARKIDSLPLELIDRLKKNALEAAKSLHYDAEVEPVIAAYSTALDERLASLRVK